LEVNSPYVEEQHNLNGSASFFTSKSISIEKFQLLTTGKVLVISTALQDYFIKKYNVEPSRFAMIPNAINAKHLSIREKQVAALREKLGYEGKQVVGFVGSLFPWHGVDILVHAFAAIYPTFPNTRLLIVGSGEILDDIKALVSHYHLEEVVIFTGSIPHEAVFEYLPLMDITVMATSNWYGSPVKIFEYGALGKAIIAPNNIPVRDVMVHQEDGILVEPNKESLVAALEYFLQYPNERIRIGQCFKDKVLSQFQWIHHAERIISISKSLHS
jgi:glycosyltransferase involved in cell wall biosynthesis